METKTEIPSRDWSAFFKKYKLKDSRQKLFLRAYDGRLLNISTACVVADVPRSTVYDWLNKLDNFKKAKESIEEDFYDKLETVMFSKAISEQDNTMLIFLAKTKMKHRGYVEKIEQEVSVNPFLDLMKRVSRKKE